MGKALTYVHRCCEACGHTVKVVKNREGQAQSGTIQCPGCGRFTLELRSDEWMRYAYWKGTIGPGRILRETIRNQKENENGYAKSDMRG